MRPLNSLLMKCRDITDQIATNTSFVIIPEEEGRRTLDVREQYPVLLVGGYGV